MYAEYRKKNGKNADTSEMKEFLDELWGKFKTSDEGKEFLSKRMRNLATLKGRYEMATLLFHSKTAITNMLGGKVNNWVWTGARHMVYALKPEAWVKINPEWDSMAKVRRWVESVGAIEDFIIHEGNLLTKTMGPKWQPFLKAVVEKLRKDPDMEDHALTYLAREHGITDTMLRRNAFFRLKSERWLRTHNNTISYIFMQT